VNVEQFKSNIEELRAEHEYLVRQLGEDSIPATKLAILERLQRVRDRMHLVGTRHVQDIRAERARRR
jgi:hypothetical protein